MSTPPNLNDLLSLRGKTAMVTGGCQNFGLEIATGLAELGADLVVTSRHAEKAEDAAADLSKKHPSDVLGIGLDITDESSVAAAFDAALARFVHIDILVNNAGGHGSNPTGDLKNETLACFSQYLTANVTGTFLMSREFARRNTDGGAIVNIASISSLIGRDRSVYAGTDMTPNPIAYTAAKAGMIGLTYDCAALLAPDKIRVNAISPGGFERGHEQCFVDAYSDHTMLGRMGRDGWDLKGAVAFLASDAAAYITAHNLVLDGGFTRYG
jgi:NAD(P)-dependent dehydrogenase (short-subunit alcohol dehydrogenase family)